VNIPDSISAEVLNFGKVEASGSVEKKFVLRNVGGVAVPFELHIPTPFQILNNPGLQVGPRSEVSISIGLFPGASKRGSVDVTMNVFGGAQTLPIRLLGNVLPGSGASSSGAVNNSAASAKEFRFGASGGSSGAVSSQTPPAKESPQVVQIPNSKPEARTPSSSSGQSWREGLSAAERAELETPMGFVPRPVVTRVVNPALRRPEDLTVIKKDSRSITAGWTAPKGTAPFTFVIEMRALYANPDRGNKPESIWIPYDNVEFERIDRLVKARIGGLSPFMTYEMRVLMIDDHDESSPPSAILTGETDMPMDWTYIYLVSGTLLVILLGFGITRIVLARRPDIYQSQYVNH